MGSSRTMQSHEPSLANKLAPVCDEFQFMSHSAPNILFHFIVTITNRLTAWQIDLLSRSNPSLPIAKFSSPFPSCPPQSKGGTWRFPWDKVDLETMEISPPWRSDGIQRFTVFEFGESHLCILANNHWWILSAKNLSNLLLNPTKLVVFTVSLGSEFYVH